ncbi:MAG: hypothetical protein IJI20_06480 [Firmicutes bacterium]|nr:hypothetical protein [Bacillota bacterium]
MKKIIIMLLCMGMILVFAACGGSGGSGGESEGGTGGSLTGLKASDLNIEDFDWEVDEAKIDGYDCYALTLTNNSKYDLLGVQIQYGPRDDVTEEQLSTFDGFLKEHEDYVRDGQTTADVMLRGDSKVYIAPGETASNVALAIGIGDYTWYDVPDENQFGLMEPEELSIGVIRGDKLYLAYYDIPDAKWKIDTETVDLNKWPEASVAGIVPRPDGKVFTSQSYDNINSFDVDVYGVSQEDFESYVNEVKEAGFSKSDFDDDDYYSGEDEKGNSITVRYYKYSQSFNISASGTDEDEDKDE